MRWELRRERTKRLLLDATEAVIREKGCAMACAVPYLLIVLHLAETILPH
mgnify:CR=1 FL=1